MLNLVLKHPPTRHDFIQALALFGSNRISKRWRGPLRLIYLVIAVWGWRTGLLLPRLVDGFNPSNFRASLRLPSSVDPTLEWMSRGTPPGPWLKEVFSPHPNKQPHFSSKNAIHIHVFYLDTLRFMLQSLAVNSLRTPMYVTYPPEIDEVELQAILSESGRAFTLVPLLENRGRDLHPFFWSLPEGVLEQFDFLVHCHTKKSLHLSRRFWETKSLGQKWLEDLVRQTLGAPDSVPVMDAIFEKMESDTSIGLSFPQLNFMSGWDENFRFARELAPDLAQADDGGVFEFPQGSFFVARTEVLKPIRKLALPIELIPKEPIPPDGTVLHAIERMIGKASESVGYRTLLVSFPRGRLWYSKCLVKTRHSSFT